MIDASVQRGFGFVKTQNRSIAFESMFPDTLTEGERPVVARNYKGSSDLDNCYDNHPNDKG